MEMAAVLTSPMRATDRVDEENIVERCRRGDLAAYRALYDRFEQPFLRTALRMLGRPQDAEDAVQEAFLKLHRGIHLYREGSRFSTYFFRILMNTCADILRKRRREPAGTVDPGEAGGADGAELRHSIEQAIDRLPGKMRACFVLFAVEEIGQEDIARILDISLGAVKANVHHARAKLRKALDASRREAKP
jgi:RNA polymerase sigma-70 factor (ECF subfamily)